MARFSSFVPAAFPLIFLGCGGGRYIPPPIYLTVSIVGTVTVSPNSIAVNVPVIIMAPTETASFIINGLPGGVAYSYKESESNPSGLLTLIANNTTMAGTYMPVIIVGSSGQTASTGFTLIVSAPPKPGAS
jgi:hypothetical protein